VLYSSVDEPLLRELVADYMKESGERVMVVGDTEATKTTGLVQRLIAERERPRCDVWWSNEPFGTIGLAGQGLFEPLKIVPALRELGWPPELIGSNDAWVGFAQRARVIVYNTERLSRDEAPTSLTDLLRPELNGRVGIARPEFGTTRGHMAALVAAHGPDRTRAYLRALKDHGVRLYDGNSVVVRAVAGGEIDVGLTDTDDVFAGQRNGWKVDFTLERIDDRSATGQWPPALTGEGTLPSIGPLVIPNTIARVRGGPNPEAAERLIEYLLSERLERLMAESEARNIPVRPGLAARLKTIAISRPMQVRLEEVEARVEEALAIAAETIGT
jgi:iron(III) transport system substrate-binding protein